MERFAAESVPIPRAARISRSRRIILILIFSLSAGTAHGQAAAVPAELAGSPVGVASGSTGETPLAVSTGRSGSIRVVVAASSAPLDLEGLRQFGGGWGNGHRWTPLPELAIAPVPDRARGSILSGLSPGPVVTPLSPGSWLLEDDSGAAVSVLTPYPATAQNGGMLNGYHIGIYPTAGTDRTDAYRPPASFIEVTPGNRDLHVSRHLRLGQFLTKDQFDVWPKYVALDLRLIDKLELVLSELNAMGIRAERLHVMSGFRTPQYNGPGGDGRASLSRHMWGDAADVWIDNDGNNLMDDLNGDGLCDLDDAAVMMLAVERVELKYPELVGGAGTYPTTSTHGPYIHIDARGERARW